MAEKEGLKFEVLSDLGNNVAKNFGLVFTLSKELQAVYSQFGIDLAKANNDRSFELPLPATYVIDQESVIRHAFIDLDHTKRLEPSEVVAILKTMNSRPSAV